MRISRRVDIPAAFVVWLFAACFCCTPARAGAIRSLAADGRVCWAVGDAGTLLCSLDAGKSFQRVPTSLDVNFQSVRAAGGQVWVFGGLAVPGHPSAAGVGLILHSPDGGRTFRPVPAGPAGWLYGGCFDGLTGVTFGQANYAEPAGMLATKSFGQQWQAPTVDSLGYARGGDFTNVKYGYLVGEDHRIISLRNLAEAAYHPPLADSKLDLNAATFCTPTQCWAVGENGRILRSQTSARPWDPIPLAMPGRCLMCADYEAVAADSPRSVYIAGGLLGVIAHTTDSGATWKLLPMPGPGTIHALLPLGRGTILAAGDGGRIWRSEDAGQTWKLVAGPDHTDVLFIASAGDRSIYPAIVAHARAGCSVAVVYATRLASLPDTPHDQPLRAAAIAAGAQAAYALGEFPSATGRAELADRTADQLMRRWSISLDTPADAEMIHQLAAAIRLYRPTAVAVGPDGSDAASRHVTGEIAENRLVSRLAQRAVAVAADPNAATDLAKVNLPAYKPARLFVGQYSNERYTPPWQSQPRTEDDARVAFDGLTIPNDAGLPLDLLAARAAWLLPGSNLLDRPAETTAYYCSAMDKRLKLFTSGLTDKPRLLMEPPTGAKRNLVVPPGLRLVTFPGQEQIAATDLAGALAKTNDPDDTAIAEDRLLLAWDKFLADGKLVQAEYIRRTIMTKAMAHPLGEKLEVLNIAAALSSEYQAQLRRQGRPEEMSAKDFAANVDAFSHVPAWTFTPSGRMLLANALRAIGKPDDARRQMGILAAEPYPLAWRRCAITELGRSDAVSAKVLKGRPVVAASLATEPGKFDGRLDDACWTTVVPIPLRPVAPETPTPRPPPSRARRSLPLPPGLALDANAPNAPELYVTISPAQFAILGLRAAALDGEAMGHRPGDRRRPRLLDAGGPPRRHDRPAKRPADLPRRPVRKASPRDLEHPGRPRRQRVHDGDRLSAQRTRAAGRPPAGEQEKWNFQVRATAIGPDDKRTDYYLAPQPDGRLLPERYALLKLPTATNGKLP